MAVRMKRENTAIEYRYIKKEKNKIGKVLLFFRLNDINCHTFR